MLELAFLCVLLHIAIKLIATRDCGTCKNRYWKNQPRCPHCPWETT